MILIVGRRDLRLPQGQNVMLSDLRPGDFAASRSDGEAVSRADFIFYVEGQSFVIVKKSHTSTMPTPVGTVMPITALMPFLRAANENIAM